MPPAPLPDAPWLLPLGRSSGPREHGVHDMLCVGTGWLEELP